MKHASLDFLDSSFPEHSWGTHTLKFILHIQNCVKQKLLFQHIEWTINSLTGNLDTEILLKSNFENRKYDKVNLSIYKETTHTKTSDFMYTKKYEDFSIISYFAKVNIDCDAILFIDIFKVSSMWQQASWHSSINRFLVKTFQKYPSARFNLVLLSTDVLLQRGEVKAG